MNNDMKTKDLRWNWWTSFFFNNCCLPTISSAFVPVPVPLASDAEPLPPKLDQPTHESKRSLPNPSPPLFIVGFHLSQELISSCKRWEDWKFFEEGESHQQSMGRNMTRARWLTSFCSWGGRWLSSWRYDLNLQLKIKISDKTGKENFPAPVISGLSKEVSTTARIRKFARRDREYNVFHDDHASKRQHTTHRYWYWYQSPIHIRSEKHAKELMCNRRRNRHRSGKRVRHNYAVNTRRGACNSARMLMPVFL